MWTEAIYDLRFMIDAFLDQVETSVNLSALRTDRIPHTTRKSYIECRKFGKEVRP
jgi:hypothetical protein